MTPAARRHEAWERWCAICRNLSMPRAQRNTLSQAPEYASKIMDNQFHGRALVKIA
jgi:acrylyl-CoA reductase (NADPH)